jgi:hypothetical protein
MSFAFDLSPHQEVWRRSEEICARAGRRNDALRRASPEEHVELFRAWIDVGMPAWAVASTTRANALLGQHVAAVDVPAQHQ